VIGDYLRDTQCRLDVTPNGNDALRLFKSGEYDVAMFDIHMPARSGVEIAAEIRHWERETGRRRTPLVVLGGSANHQNGHRDEQSGKLFDAELSKPFTRSSLLEVLSRVTHSGQVSHADLPSSQSQIFRLFLGEAPGLIQKIETSLAGGDHRAASDAAHRLTGDALSVGAEGFAGMSRNLEVAIAAGTADSDVLAQMAGEVDRLKRELSRVLH